jgi:hypothetical protein
MSLQEETQETEGGCDLVEPVRGAVDNLNVVPTPINLNENREETLQE